LAALESTKHKETPEFHLKLGFQA